LKTPTTVHHHTSGGQQRLEPQAALEQFITTVEDLNGAISDQDKKIERGLGGASLFSHDDLTLGCASSP